MQLLRYALTADGPTVGVQSLRDAGIATRSASDFARSWRSCLTSESLEKEQLEDGWNSLDCSIMSTYAYGYICIYIYAHNVNHVYVPRTPTSLRPSQPSCMLHQSHPGRPVPVVEAQWLSPQRSPAVPWPVSGSRPWNSWSACDTPRSARDTGTRPGSVDTWAA